MDLTTGRLTWRLSPGGNRVAGDPITGRRVTLHRRYYSTARVAVLIATGRFPAAGRVPRNVAAAVRGERVHYAVETPQRRMIRLVRDILGLEQVQYNLRGTQMPNASIPVLDKSPATPDKTEGQPAFNGSGYSVGGMPYHSVSNAELAVIPTTSSKS